MTFKLDTGAEASVILTKQIKRKASTEEHVIDLAFDQKSQTVF